MTNREDRDPDNSRRGPLIALLIVAVLFIIGWVLARELYANGRLEDCLLSGRTNCAPVQSPQR